MTQDDKQLLWVDLCARLPYGVKCQFEDDVRVIDGESSPFYDYTLSAHNLELFIRHNNFYIKPYLRPMSSMTTEEQKEFVKFHCVNICPIVITEKLTISNEAEMFDWLNKKMFDYRGLIPNGYAISTEEFNPYKDDAEKKELKKIEPKTLDPYKVIEWLNEQSCQGWIEDVEVDKFVDKFKKDFEI